MRKERLLNACLLALAGALLMLGDLPAFAQANGVPIAGRARKKPFLGGPLPKESTRVQPKAGRGGGATAQTVDLTPNTPLVTDAHPFWSSDERFIAFESNRNDLPGTQVGSPASRFHIYRLPGGGGPVQALTGPLSTGQVGANTSQSEPAFDPNNAKLVYIESGGGALDLVELDLASRTTRSLVRNNTQGFNFVALNGPEYGGHPELSGSVILFAGQQPGQPFKIFAVATQSGQIRQVTFGPCDDRNPTLSPAGPTGSLNLRVIAFDSNRADASGDSTNGDGHRDIWSLPSDLPNDDSVAPTRVTDFSPAGASSNVEPSWSTNKIDQVNGSQSFVNGQQLLGFASTRYDTANDGNADAVNPNGTHDIYWLKATVGADPTTGRAAVITPESTFNAALKLRTNDDAHALDDRWPTWPQFVGTYRVAYDTNRTSFDPITGVSGGPAATRDIFSSTLLDLNVPTLCRINEVTGEIISVQPRNASPGQTVTIRAKFLDLETGIRDVWAQIKNPNSKYQWAGGVERRSYVFAGLNLDASNIALNVPIEYDSQRIFIGQDPNDARVGTYANAGYVSSLDDFFAFSGSQSPPDEAWLKLEIDTANPRDAKTGAYNFVGQWTTPSTASDYYIDMIVYDNALDPFSGDNANWRIYDNVGGLTTQAFVAGAHKILFVNDNGSGQKFFNSRFGVNSLVNVTETFWGTESWMTDIDLALLPTRYSNGALVLVLNTLGPKSYGAIAQTDPFTILNYDPLALDGTVIDGADVPVTQQYDLWRVLSRGPVPDSVLQAYAPRTEQQPGDVIGGSAAPRNVLVADRCVIFHSPFAGSLFVGPGTITDLSVQSQLAAFARAGGRLLVNGKDIAWALTLDGTTPNSFLSGTLRATYVRDDAPGLLYRIPSGPFTALYLLTTPNQLTASPAYNPISNDPWLFPKYIGSTAHSWPGPPFPPGTIDFISNEPNFIVGGIVGNPRLYGSPSNLYTDVMQAPTGSVVDFAYGGGIGTAMMHYEDTSTGSRVVYSPMGLEGLTPDFFAPPNTTNILALKNRRAEVVHNTVCWLRTGAITGQVLTLDGGTGLGNVLVRLSRQMNAQGQIITAYTAVTASDGSFLINGIDPDSYEISAFKAGLQIQRRTFVTMHGGGVSDQIAFRMTPAAPATLKGKVTRIDGTTPVQGATVTIVDNLDATNTSSATTDVFGAYVFDQVKANTTYTVTCAAAGFGESVPVNYPLPNPQDPIAGQRDTVVQPAKTYLGFDFKMKAEQGAVTGEVVRDADSTGIAGAVVTATSGAQTVTAVTDANGNYSFDKTNTPPNGLEAGGWSLVATAPGFQANAPVQVTVISNDTVVAPQIRLQTVPPGLISGLVTRTNDGNPLPGVSIEVRDGAGNLVESATTGAATTDGSGYRFNYRIQDVPAGVTYKVTASLTGYTPTPLTADATVTSQTETKNVNFSMQPLHTFGGNLSLVSAPYDYVGNDIGDLLDIPTGDRTNGAFLFATWDISRYFFYPVSNLATTFRLGRGYFMRYTNNLALTTEGVTAPTNAPFDIPLNIGWNLIGNPFLFDLDWTKVDVVVNGVPKSHSQAVADGDISAALYSLVSGSYVLDFRIRTWRGYWARAYRNVVLRYDPQNDQYGRAAASVPNSRAVLQEQDGWTVNLRVTAGQLRDEDNYFGMSSRAADGFDRFKVEKPPVFGEQFAYLAFGHEDWGDKSGGYGVDVRSTSAAEKTWEFTVRTSGGNLNANLTWPNASQVDKRYNLTVTDVASGRALDMRTNSSLNWQTGDEPAERRFRVSVDRSGQNRLTISALRSRQGAGGRASGVNIGFNLSVAADVEIRILAATGARLRTVSSRASRAAGVQEATWDMKDDRGTSVPAGAYNVEIRATSRDGKQTVRQVAPVLIVR